MDLHRVDPLGAGLLEQAGWCDQLDAPFTAGLLRTLAGPLRTEVDRLVAPLGPAWSARARSDALALRLAGALHTLVLAGRAPGLAPWWPPGARSMTPGDGFVPAVGAALDEHAAELRAHLQHPPQTNEVRRSAVLLGGYAEIARRTGLPLALHEIGASAGLNQLWDRCAYRLTREGPLPPLAWGPADSPVSLGAHWEGAAPDLSAPIAVSRRAACDLAPIDLDDDAARTRLMGWVWPEQTERMDRLRSAIELARARRLPAPEAADAAEWVERRLQARPAGECWVLVHSVVWQYLPPATQQRIAQAMEAAGRDADPSRALAWLRMEPPVPQAPQELRLRLWPTGQDERLGTAHPHGQWLRWCAPDQRRL